MRDSLAFQILLLGSLASLGTYVWGVERSSVSVSPNLLGVQAFQDGSGFLLAASFAMSVGGTILLGLVAAGGLVVYRRLAER